jgi:hypothetical protein
VDVSPQIPATAANSPSHAVEEHSPTATSSPAVADTHTTPSPIAASFPVAAESSAAMSPSPAVADSTTSSSLAYSDASPLTSSPLPPNAIPVLVPFNDHVMCTCGKRSFQLSQHRLNLIAATPISPIPSTYQCTPLDLVWLSAMRDEFDALQQNKTWTLVPKPSGVNVVSGKWGFHHKFHADRTLSRYKACWVCRGFSQQQGIDYEETFSHVVKSSTIRVVLSITISTSWPLHQLDVKKCFSSWTSLLKLSIVNNPLVLRTPDHVCLLHKSLYGLKQTPRAWFQCFASFI